jgi:hypothetical protein
MFRLSPAVKRELVVSIAEEELVIGSAFLSKWGIMSFYYQH